MPSVSGFELHKIQSQNARTIPLDPAVGSCRLGIRSCPQNRNPHIRINAVSTLVSLIVQIRPSAAQILPRRQSLRIACLRLRLYGGSFAAMKLTTILNRCRHSEVLSIGTPVSVPTARASMWSCGRAKVRPQSARAAVCRRPAMTNSRNNVLSSFFCRDSSRPWARRSSPGSPLSARTCGSPI